MGRYSSINFSSVVLTDPALTIKIVNAALVTVLVVTVCDCLCALVATLVHSLIRVLAKS